MKTLPLASTLLVLAGLAGPLAAQGVPPDTQDPDTLPPRAGGYRGPGDIVVPNPNAPRGQYAGPGDTNGPLGSPPSFGGPRATPTPTPTPVQPLLAPVSGIAAEDPSVWSLWWAFNRDPYLRLKEHLYERELESGTDDFFLGRGSQSEADGRLRPHPHLVHGRAVPALLEVLRNERNDELLAEALLALGKIGPPGDDVPGPDADEVEAALRGHVGHSNVLVAERAVLALGVYGTDRSAFFLADLLEDRPTARRAVGGNAVSERTRAFAAYALGLVGHRSAREDVRRFVVHKLVGALETWSSGPYDVPVAIVNALGVVPLAIEAPGAAADEPPAPTSSRQALVHWLLDYHARRDAKYRVRAHVPVAVGRLLAGLPGADPSRLRAAEVLADALGPRSREHREVQQGSAIGLGLLADADRDALDRDVRKALMRAAKDSGDQTVRHFALIALARAGARPGPGQGEPLDGEPEVRAFLAHELQSGRSLSRPWSALALGVHGRGLADVRVPPPSDTGELLAASLADSDSTRDLGAFSIASGLHGVQDAYDDLVELVRDHGQDDVRGYAAVAVGLLDARQAQEELARVVASARFRPELASRVAIGLALLGDKGVVTQLLEMLTDAGSQAGQSTLARALGFVGDARSVEPLVELLEREDLTDLARAFLAHALGTVAEKDMLPWRVVYSVDANYLAATPTLTGQRGVLDLD